MKIPIIMVVVGGQVLLSYQSSVFFQLLVVIQSQDLRRQTPRTPFLVDIYVLKTMIYCRNRVSLRKS